MVNQVLNGHQNSELFLNKYFAGHTEQRHEMVRSGKPSIVPRTRPCSGCFT
jgi:hypothetical protein